MTPAGVMRRYPLWVTLGPWLRPPVLAVRGVRATPANDRRADPGEPGG
jgi:hypothetical protein